MVKAKLNSSENITQGAQLESSMATVNPSLAMATAPGSYAGITAGPVVPLPGGQQQPVPPGVQTEKVHNVLSQKQTRRKWIMVNAMFGLDKEA